MSTGSAAAKQRLSQKRPMMVPGCLSPAWLGRTDDGVRWFVSGSARRDR